MTTSKLVTRIPKLGKDRPPINIGRIHVSLKFLLTESITQGHFSESVSAKCVVLSKEGSRGCATHVNNFWSIETNVNSLGWYAVRSTEISGQVGSFSFLTIPRSPSTPTAQDRSPPGSWPQFGPCLLLSSWPSTPPAWRLSWSPERSGTTLWAFTTRGWVKSGKKLIAFDQRSIERVEATWPSLKNYRIICPLKWPLCLSSCLIFFSKDTVW